MNLEARIYSARLYLTPLHQEQSQKYPERHQKTTIFRKNIDILIAVQLTLRVHQSCQIPA